MTASGIRSESPSAVEVITAYIEQFAADLHVALPGRVQRYDAATGTVDVQPDVRHPVAQPDGATTYETLPVLARVPVAFARSGPWALLLPIAAGDTGTLLFCSAAIGAWQTGDGAAPAYPGDLRRHHLAHAIFVPGLATEGHALGSASATDLVLGKDGGFQAVFKPGAIGPLELGGSAFLAAVAEYVDDRIAKLQKAFDAHQHSGVTTGVGVSGPPNPAIGIGYTIPVGPLGSVASDRVKLGG